MRRAAARACLYLLLAGPAAAGPVGGDNIEAPSGSLTPPAGTLPDGAAAVPIDLLLPSAGTRAETSGSAESTPSPSVQAAEILREAESGTAAAEPAPARRQGLQRAGAPAATPAAEEDNSLREFAKATVHWLKESVPWLRKDAQDEDAGNRAVMGADEWSASALAGDKAARSFEVGQVRLAERAEASPMPPDSSAGYRSSAQQPGLGPQHNIVREAIEFLRTVLLHPMTWLVLALFAIGGYAVSKFDRRPK
jgi:hypothetical protein